MSASPVFVGTPKVWDTQISAANTGRDGSGTLGTLVSAGASGSRIDKIRMMGVGTVTNGIIRLFLDDGTNKRLYMERAVAATVPSGTAVGWEDEVTFADGLVLPTGWSLKAAPHNAETFNLFAQGGDI